MTVSKYDIQDRAREFLPYFQEARSDYSSPLPGTDEPDDSRRDFPTDVMRVEKAARAETNADWDEKYFYGLVAETLMDIAEYGDHRWEEEAIAPSDMIDEIASDVSVSAFYEELFEWAHESPEWSDVSRELEAPQADDGEMELELMQEGMGNDIYNIRRAVLREIYDQLQAEEESEPPA